MRFIATVEGTHGVHAVWLRPIGYRFAVNTRPRPAVGIHLAIELAGLVAPTREALDAWQVVHAPAHELVRPYFREAQLADLMDAVNADAFLHLAREASADELAVFAQNQGGALLAEVRAQLGASVVPEAVAALSARAARLAAIAGIASAPTSLAELAALHPVEQLMALEHAVAQWIQATTEPPADELAALAKQLPDERVSAGVSKAWFAWWWRLAYRSPRGDLRDAVHAAVELARRECGRSAIARAACDEAAAMLDRMRVATGARMWSEPPDDNYTPTRDVGDAHYCAYMAVTHAAHGIAAALRDDHDAGDANRHAMQLVASRALEVLRGAT